MDRPNPRLEAAPARHDAPGAEPDKRAWRRRRDAASGMNPPAGRCAAEPGCEVTMADAALGLAAIVLGYGVSALFLALGLGSFISIRRHLDRCTGRALGTVVGHTEPDEQGCSRPLVRFDHGGTTVTFTGEVGSRPPAYAVGQRVPVRFPRGEPEGAVIADWRNLYSFPLAIGAIGGFGLVVLTIAVIRELLKR
jgi:hypothetical protein